jgi:Transposase, Mutator family
VHFYRNVFSRVPNGKMAEVARMLKAIHAQEDLKAARMKAVEIVQRLKDMKLRSAAELVEQKVDGTLTYYAYPSTHWRQIKTVNPRRSFPRRTLGAYGGCGETQTHRLDEMGQGAIHGHGSAAQSGEAGGCGVKTFCSAFGRSDGATASPAHRKTRLKKILDEGEDVCPYQ